MARLGLFALPFPEGGGWRRWRFNLVLPRHGGDRSRRCQLRHHARGGGLTGHLAYRPSSARVNKQQCWLEPLLGPVERLWAFGLTEPDAGSDAAAIQTRAVRDGDQWSSTVAKRSSQCGHRHQRRGVTITAITGSHNGTSRSARSPSRGEKRPGTRRRPNPQARMARIRHARVDLRGLPCAVQQPVGTPGQGLTQFLQITRERSRRDPQRSRLGSLSLSPMRRSGTRRRGASRRADRAFQGTQFKLATWGRRSSWRGS